jgi:hypothetical protein
MTGRPAPEEPQLPKPVVLRRVIQRVVVLVRWSAGSLGAGRLPSKLAESTCTSGVVRQPHREMPVRSAPQHALTLATLREIEVLRIGDAEPVEVAIVRAWRKLRMQPAHERARTFGQINGTAPRRPHEGSARDGSRRVGTAGVRVEAVVSTIPVLRPYRLRSVDLWSVEVPNTLVSAGAVGSLQRNALISSGGRRSRLDARIPDCEDVPLLAGLPGRWRCPDCGRGRTRTHPGELVAEEPAS